MINNVTTTVLRRPKDCKAHEMIYIKKAEYEKLVELSKAVVSMRNEALTYQNWYTFVTCEFGERIDETLKALGAIDDGN